MDTSGEIISAIDFESYTADNTTKYDHIRFTGGSEGMYFRLRDGHGKPDVSIEDSLEKEKDGHGRCGLLSGVFQTCSNDDELKKLMTKCTFIAAQSDVGPQLVFKQKDSSGSLICTWQVAKVK